MLSIGLTTFGGPGRCVSDSRRLSADLERLRQAGVRVVELALQTSDDIGGIDVVTRGPCLVPRAQATGNELGVDALALDTGTHRDLDEFREALALSEPRFDLDQELGLAKNGEDACGLYGYKVAQRRPRSSQGSARLVAPTLSIRLTSSSPARQPPTKPSSFSEATGASRRGPPVKGRTYMQPAWSGTTDTTSW